MMKLVDKYGIGLLILFILLFSEAHLLNSDVNLSAESFASRLPQTNVYLSITQD